MTSLAKPQVFIEQTTGLMVDHRITRGDVDVIFIDWSEITPDHDGTSDMQFDNFEAAHDDALRLPREIALPTLIEMAEWLETYIDPHTGYTERDAFRGRMVRELKGLKQDIAKLEVVNLE